MRKSHRILLFTGVQSWTTQEHHPRRRQLRLKWHSLIPILSDKFYSSKYWESTVDVVTTRAYSTYFGKEIKFEYLSGKKRNAPDDPKISLLVSREAGFNRPCIFRDVSIDSEIENYQETLLFSLILTDSDILTWSVTGSDDTSWNYFSLSCPVECNTTHERYRYDIWSTRIAWTIKWDVTISHFLFSLFLIVITSIFRVVSIHRSVHL